MRLIISSILLVMLGILSAQGKGQETLDYEIEGAGTATQGNYLVKVTVMTKDKKLPDSELRAYAVRGVLFRGFSNSSSRVNQRPLAGSAASESKNADFYKDFFSESGTASSYGSIVNGSRSVVKSGKLYRVSATVTVNKDLLLKDLTDAGVIKGLNSAF